MPARNTIFLSLALGWAEVLEASDIVIGVNALDYSGYPDCRPEFIRAFESLATLATRAGVEGGRFRVHTPLIDLTKAEIIRRGLALGLDYGLTHSCYDPQPDGRPCGRCDSCALRARGFAEAGVADPLAPALRSQLIVRFLTAQPLRRQILVTTCAVLLLLAGAIVWSARLTRVERQDEVRQEAHSVARLGGCLPQSVPLTGSMRWHRRSCGILPSPRSIRRNAPGCSRNSHRAAAAAECRAQGPQRRAGSIGRGSSCRSNVDARACLSAGGARDRAARRSASCTPGL